MRQEFSPIVALDLGIQNPFVSVWLIFLIHHRLIVVVILSNLPVLRVRAQSAPNRQRLTLPRWKDTFSAIWYGPSRTALRRLVGNVRWGLGPYTCPHLLASLNMPLGPMVAQKNPEVLGVRRQKLRSIIRNYESVYQRPFEKETGGVTAFLEFPSRSGVRFGGNKNLWRVCHRLVALQVLTAERGWAGKESIPSALKMTRRHFCKSLRC